MMGPAAQMGATLASLVVGSTVAGNVGREFFRRSQKHLQAEKPMGDEAVKALVTRYLGPEARVEKAKVPNAYYGTRDGKPLVGYGPGFDRESIIMHEIGHGVRQQEGRLSHRMYGPSRTFGPAASSLGATLLALSSKGGRRTGAGLLAGGGLLSLPHLVEERQASRWARRESGESYPSLGPAYGTYLTNALVEPAAAGGGAWAIKRIIQALRLRALRR